MDSLRRTPTVIKDHLMTSSVNTNITSMAEDTMEHLSMTSTANNQPHRPTMIIMASNPMVDIKAARRAALVTSLHRLAWHLTGPNTTDTLLHMAVLLHKTNTVNINTTTNTVDHHNKEVDMAEAITDLHPQLGARSTWRHVGVFY